MAFVPSFDIFESDGVALVYAIPKVVLFDDFQDPSDFVEHKSLRGVGSIVSPDSDTQAEDGNASWELPVGFYLKGTDYSDLMVQIQAMKTAIKKFTKYIVKRETSISTTKDYKVMRVSGFTLPVNSSGKKQVDWQKVEFTLLVNAWQ